MSTSLPARPLSVGEAIVLGIGVIGGIGAWASLALAHAGEHSLPAVGAVTAVVAVGIAMAAPRPRLQVDRAELLLIGGVAVVAGVMFFPGFRYAAGDKDPGVYVGHAEAIARTGSYRLVDPVLEPGLGIPHPQAVEDNSKFPGVWIDERTEDEIVPQFFHLLPAAMATVSDIAGDRGVFNLTPALGVLSVVALTLAVRRPFGTTAAALTGVLLATNMLQVWQAKYPTTEVMAQAFIALVLLGLVVALDTRWAPAAGAAGLCTGLVFLARIDGILLVVMAAAAGAALVALRRWDIRASWYAAGVAGPLVHGLAQAWHFAPMYARNNDMPGRLTLAAVAVLLAVGAIAGRRLLPLVDGTRRRFPRARWHRVGGVVVVAGVVAVLLFNLARPLFGDSVVIRDGEPLRLWNERNLLRLSWFVTWPVIALVPVGVALVALRRWRAAAWATFLPGLVLMPLYLWQARVAARLMWWGRRYVTVVLLAIVVLAAIALADGLRRRRPAWLRVGAAALAAVTIGVYLSQSWPLRDHREMGGSAEVLAELAATSPGEQGLYLFPQEQGLFDPGELFGGGVWLVHDELSAWLRERPLPEHIDAYVRAFPDHPVFLVAEHLPPTLAPVPLEEVARLTGRLPFWDETHAHRPDHDRGLTYDITVFRVTSSSG